MSSYAKLQILQYNHYAICHSLSFWFLVFPGVGYSMSFIHANLFVTVSTGVKIWVFPLMGSLVSFLQCGLCCALASVGTRFCLFLTKHEPSCCYHSCDQIHIASTSWDETTYSLPFYISLSWRTCKHSGAVHFGNCSACILLPCSQSFQMPHMFLDGHIYVCLESTASSLVELTDHFLPCVLV